MSQTKANAGVPAPETDRELLDRLLPGWRIEDSQDGAMVRLDGLFFELGLTPDLAIAAAASTLRAILARDRETRVEAEAKPEAPVLRRWPIGVAGCAVIANDGTMWRESISLDMWLRVRSLPQPREDGGE